jgi:hypothetical protein
MREGVGVAGKSRAELDAAHVGANIMRQQAERSEWGDLREPAG